MKKILLFDFVKKNSSIITAITAALLLISLVVGLIFAFRSCEKDDITHQVGTGACEYFGTLDNTGKEIKYVKMSVKDHGTMIILLDATTAPITVANFLKLTNEKFYDGLTFHRVMSNFMIQGGDPRADGTGGSNQNIKGEFLSNGHWNDISHVRGVISMARSNNHNSASSQFFICNADASVSLDYEYAAFGYVIAGMSVVDSITKVTEPYADKNKSNVIPDKSKQAVIVSVVEITEEEALNYANQSSEN